MAAIVRVDHPGCNDNIRLDPREVRLILAGPYSHYEFTCTTCGERIRKYATDPVIAALGKVGITGVQVPAEILEPRRHTKMPPISSDDFIEFALWLKDASSDIVEAATTGITLR